MEYATYRAGPDRWALGRFVLPLTYAAELAQLVRARAGADLPWPVSAVLGAGTDVDPAAFLARRAELAGTLSLDSAELRAESETDVDAAVPLVRAGVDVYVECPLDARLDAVAGAIHRAGAAAKIRTGGVVPGAIPSPEAVLRFLHVCRRHGTSFKATAGLHHPVRGEFPLTYEPGSVRATMHGYLNVLLAAALVRDGRPDEDALDLLRERSPGAFTCRDGTLAWREESFPAARLRALRSGFLASFGSCSFREPFDEIPRALAAA